MAAAERDGQASDLESVSLSADIECCSTPRSSPDSDISSASHSREINAHSSEINAHSRAVQVPSYVIVQRQMQDVLLTHRAAVEQLLRNNIEVLNESKTSFGKVVSSQEEKLRMLEKSVTEDYVPKVMYDSLRMEVQENFVPKEKLNALQENFVPKEKLNALQENFVPKEKLNALQENLEQEYGRHRQMEAQLQEVWGRLDVALCQVAALTKQMEDDKLMFHSTCEHFREEILELQASHKDIESRLAEKTWLCEEQKGQIAQQLVEIETLQKKQQTQTVKYKQMVLEANIEKQQEVYLSQLFNDKNKQNKKCL
ncbi:hypothetical protein BsWGS_00044 [Bradybaena similaris]